MYYKYSGAGNTFAVLDGRDEDPKTLEQIRLADTVEMICTELTTDGLMILTEHDGLDFGMEYYNNDGSGGMMCGNGGRCIVAFADYLGIKPADGEAYRFMAPDGEHTAQILSRDGMTCVVRLKMSDVQDIKYYEELSEEAPVDGYFLNTGTRHFVVFADDVEDVAVEKAGSVIRRSPEFAPEGTNADFVSPYNGGIKVRTFEKGVEAETMACGTGITASAIAAYRQGIPPTENAEGRVRYAVRSRLDDLSVDFIPGERPIATDIHLTGPAELVYML